MKTLISAYLIITLALLSGCGSLEKKWNQDAVKNTKRVAILSYTVYQQKQADNLGLGALNDAVKGKNPSESPEMKAFMKASYKDLTKQLKRSLKKDVFSMKKVTSSSTYKQLYKDKMTGPIRAGSLHGQNTEMIHPTGIINQANFQGLPFAIKAELAKSMGADAFVEFNATQEISQGWGLGNIMGSGDFSYNTRSSITMYSVDSEEPIWRIQNVDGPQSQTSAIVEGGSPTKKRAVIGQESVKASTKKVMKSLAL